MLARHRAHSTLVVELIVKWRRRHAPLLALRHALRREVRETDDAALAHDRHALADIDLGRQGPGAGVGPGAGGPRGWWAQWLVGPVAGDAPGAGGVAACGLID